MGKVKANVEIADVPESEFVSIPYGKGKVIAGSISGFYFLVSIPYGKGKVTKIQIADLIKSINSLWER